MKKWILAFLSLATITISPAQNLRETIAIVRPKLDETTQTFLSDFGKSLRRDGFYSAADILQSYGRDSFGTGFTYRDERNPIYLIPYAKALGGLYFGPDITGINYGLGAGMEIAYKLGYQNYIFANIGYTGRRMKPFDDEEFRLKSKTLSGLACSIGISF